LNWHKKRVIVTGGAGFIGGALVEKLLARGSTVTVVDKIFAGTNTTTSALKMERLNSIFQSHGAEPNVAVLDLATEAHRFELLCKDVDATFHLSALFGGREFVNTRQADCARMFAVDHNTIEASQKAGVPRFHYASSACVYPDSLQKTPGRPLKESDALSTGEGFLGADNLYGWAKLMGELQCKVYHDEKGMATSTCRYLTVYGPGEMDTSHAISALVERALGRSDPFEIWGSGKQERGFTYVDDIVDGSIRACEAISDGTPINLGTETRYPIDKVVEMIFGVTGFHPRKIIHNTSKPEGPFSRALDVSKAKALLGWEPRVGLEAGLRKTIEWHSRFRSLKAGSMKQSARTPPK
jgi:UDP-glucose 4-epimerase